MIDALVMFAALSLPSDPVDREWAVNRPTRGSSLMVNTIARAATPPPSVYDWAACVLDRESGGTFDRRQSGTGALNTSGHQGRWQFSRNWNHGGPYMVRDRLIQFGMPAKQAREVRLYLSARPIYRWHGFYQDILFNEAVERDGSHHWAFGGGACDSMRPR